MTDVRQLNLQVPTQDEIDNMVDQMTALANEIRISGSFGCDPNTAAMMMLGTQIAGILVAIGRSKPFSPFEE